MQTQTIIDTSYYSTGFPNRKWNELIDRDNYLNQIEGDLQTENKIIFIEGDEDSGKTSLCAQFCRKQMNNSISVFFNPLSTLDFQIDFFYSNIVPQIRFLLGEEIEEIEKESYIGSEKYRSYLFQLKKKLKKSNTIVYLVIDGLEDKFKNHSDLINSLLENLPLGEEYFRIIITGNKIQYINLCANLRRIPSKSMTLAGFTSHEISTFLKINDTTSAEIKDLYKITKGFPGRLETLKRLLEKHGYILTDIINTSTYNKWVELDCEKIDLEDKNNNAILSIIALSDNTFQINDITKITSLTYDETIKKIEELYVLDIQNLQINFTSNSHKKYFYNLLRGNKKKIYDILIKYYASEDTLQSKFELSKIYAEKSEWQKILPIINEEYLIDTLESTGSLQKVTEGLELGFMASENMNKYSELWKYSIQGSIVNELDNYLFWESEILARISLKDFAGAIALAENAVLKVDRLRLLALVARKEKQINNNVDEELISLIQDLYKNTDLSSVGDVIYDIVSDLIYAIPNLAIEIIENSSGNASEKNINEWIIAKLSIAAISSSSSDDNSEVNKKINAIESINYPSVKKIHRSISFLVGNYSATKVLEEVKKLSDSNERLKLLRLWLSNNKDHINDINIVIDKALDELVTTSSESTITLDILKELSYQLAYVKEYEIKKQLHIRFKNLAKDLKDLGLTKDKYIYQLNIFHTEYTLNKEKSIPSITEIINEVDKIEDILVRIESYSEVYAKLHTINSSYFTGKFKFVYSRILTLSEELLKSTANHYKICENITTTISKVNPILCLKICKNVNTVYSRDRLRLLIIDTYLDNNLKEININFLKEIDDSFENIIPKNLALKSVLERYSEAKSIRYEIIRDLFYFTNKICFLNSPENKVYNYLLNYRIIAKNIEWNKRLSKGIKAKIVSEWENIEADWERIDAGFIICSEIAKIDEQFANEVFKNNEKFKKDSWIDSESIANTYLNSMKLVIRAYNGLLITNNETKNDYSVLEDLINRIPSEIEKLKLWTEIGLNSYLSTNHEITKKVYDIHILPLIQGIIYKNLNLDSILDSMILVHHFNSELAIEYLTKFSLFLKEEACMKISEFYISNRSPFEIYDGEMSKYDSTANDILKAVSLLNHVETDSAIFNLVHNICNAITNNKNVISKVQITEIASKLESVILKKLPDLKNIQHDGYKIICQVKIEVIKKQAVNWQKFIDDTNNIPNQSDKLFVKSLLMQSLPFDKMNDGRTIKANLFNEIIDELEKLKSHYEFVERVIDTSDIMYEIDRNKWKTIVNKAFSISNEFEEGSEMYEYQKKIIDSMYRLDPEYSKQLIKMIDNEDKENKNLNLLKNFHSTLEVTNKIKNNQTLEQKEKTNHQMIVRSILRAHAALNSGKITTKKISEVSKYLYIGNKLPLHEVFPIYMYYLSNCAKTYKVKNSDSSLSELHTNNFREAVKATNLVQLLSEKRKINQSTTRKFFIDEDFSTNMAVKPGTREEAMNFIHSWMQDEIQDFVIIADPYYVKEDIEILKMIKEINENIDINILGCDDGQKTNVEEEYKSYWKKISDELPPFTNITFCWVPEDNNNKPIHDRWIITNNSGLRLGTSFNSLGKKKESEISVMKPNEALLIKEQTLTDYINKKKKEFNNQRLSYKGFTL